MGQNELITPNWHVALIHYPIALHLSKAYEAFAFCPGDFPIAEKLASQVLSLPMFPELTVSQQERVVREVLKVLGSRQDKL